MRFGCIPSVCDATRELVGRRDSSGKEAREAQAKRAVVQSLQQVVVEAPPSPTATTPRNDDDRGSSPVGRCLRVCGKKHSCCYATQRLKWGLSLEKSFAAPMQIAHRAVCTGGVHQATD